MNCPACKQPVKKGQLGNHVKACKVLEEARIYTHYQEEIHRTIETAKKPSLDEYDQRNK